MGEVCKGLFQNVYEGMAGCAGEFFSIFCTGLLNLLFSGAEPAQKHGAEGKCHLFFTGNHHLRPLFAHVARIAHVGGVGQYGNFRIDVWFQS